MHPPLTKPQMDRSGVLEIGCPENQEEDRRRPKIHATFTPLM